MHAFLIVGGSEESREEEIDTLIAKYKLKRENITLQKISDVRAHTKEIRLKEDTPHAYVIFDIDNATTETLNAFLKNLEEPQDTVYYILTAQSVHSVLPTIVSRCQVITSKSNANKTNAMNKDLQDYFAMSVGEKLNYTSKIKERDEAIEFMTQVIIFLNEKSKSKKDTANLIRKVNQADKTRNALIANGNVQLQLSNFVIQES